MRTFPALFRGGQVVTFAVRTQQAAKMPSPAPKHFGFEQCTIETALGSSDPRSAHHEGLPSRIQGQAHGGHSSQDAAGCNGALCSARHAPFHQRHSHEGGQQRSYSGHGVVHSQAQSPHLGWEHLARMSVNLSAESFSPELHRAPPGNTCHKLDTF